MTRIPELYNSGILVAAITHARKSPCSLPVAFARLPMLGGHKGLPIPACFTGPSETDHTHLTLERRHQIAMPPQIRYHGVPWATRPSPWPPQGASGRSVERPRNPLKEKLW